MRLGFMCIAAALSISDSAGLQQKTPTPFEFDTSPYSITCVLLVMTPHGAICVKMDGSVEIPSGVSIDTASREFWETLAKTNPFIKQEK